MDGLVQSARTVAQGSRGQHTDGACDLGRLIGQNVTEHIGGNDDIELRGVAHKLHSGVVHQHIGALDVGILLCGLMDDLAPQAGGFQHVCLVDTD